MHVEVVLLIIMSAAYLYSCHAKLTVHSHLYTIWWKLLIDWNRKYIQTFLWFLVLVF